MSTLMLSPNASILSNKNYVIEDSQNGVNYVFYLKINNSIITLSSLMNDILLKFETPHDIKDVVSALLDEFNLPEDKSLQKKIFEFIKKMKNLKILIYPESKKEIKEFNLELGININGYTINQLIAKTKKSAIYKCQKEFDNNTYIFKVLTNKHSQKYFERELEPMKKIKKHLNVRCLVDYGEYKDFHYLILEYIEGKSILKTAEELKIKHKIGLCKQLLNSINYIHSLGILHGDIHSSNFLVTTKGLLKLIDLGMSYNIEDKSNEYHGGVPHFMPPERVYDHNIKFSVKKGDVKSEIFQLGIIMYQIIYGKNPFTGILWKDLAKSIKNDKPIFDDKTLNGEEIPADLILIISKSLEKKPDNRFESTTTALQELNKINIYYNEETDINN